MQLLIPIKLMHLIKSSQLLQELDFTENSISNFQCDTASEAMVLKLHWPVETYSCQPQALHSATVINFLMGSSGRGLCRLPISHESSIRDFSFQVSLFSLFCSYFPPSLKLDHEYFYLG